MLNELSVVLINAGRDSDLVSCCSNLARHRFSGQVEIIVVQKGTADETQEAVQRLIPSVRWLETTSFGVAAMRNIGAEASHGRLLLFLDTDTELAVGALDELMSAFRQTPMMGAAGGKLLNPDGSLQFSARRFYTLTSMLLRRTPGSWAARSDAVRDHLLADWDHQDERSVDWVVGACLAVRRDAWAEVGPFSEATAFGFEDVDWCYRARRRGWDIRYVPTARIVHRYVRSSTGLNRRTISHAVAAMSFAYGLARARIGRRIAMAALDGNVAGRLR
jgi:N-acetylglucosaminyl-diphospho-decaprenol L-rhamnosyltransferase